MSKMHPKISELLYKSFVSTNDGKLSPLNTTRNIEYLAHLIVLECAQVAIKYESPHLNCDDNLIIAKKIKEKFGIE